MIELFFQGRVAGVTSSSSEEKISRARELLAELAKQIDASCDFDFKSSSEPVPAETRLLVTAKAWQRANAVRRAFFNNAETLFVDPAWEILLDLYIQDREGGRVSVSSACIAAQVPATTGLRWLERLQRDGLISRAPDPRDGRKVYVALTGDAIARVERCLAGAAESDRRLGLGRLQTLQ
jgi:hypothetical protein